MSALTLSIPDDVERALQQEAARTGESPEEVVVKWLREKAPTPQRGTVEAIQPFFGAWSMTSGERAEIERLIEEERLLEDGLN